MDKRRAEEKHHGTRPLEETKEWTMEDELKKSTGTYKVSGAAGKTWEEEGGGQRQNDIEIVFIQWEKEVRRTRQKG